MPPAPRLDRPTPTPSARRTSPRLPLGRWGVGVAGLLLALGLTGCGEDTSVADPSSAPQAAAGSGEVTFEDGWVKAVDAGMSAAFGELTNGTDQDITLVRVSSPVSDSVQLHETIPQEDGSMAMQEKADGFTVAAGSHHHFSPGDDHLMIMGLTQPIKAGDEVPFTLTFDDGTTLDISLVAKTFDGGDEEYHSHDDSGAGQDPDGMDEDMDTDMGEDMNGMDMGGDDGS